MRRVQVERRYGGTPIVDVAIGPGRRNRFDTVEDDVLPGVGSRRQPGLVVGGSHRRLVGIPGGVHHPHPPHQASACLVISPARWPASDHATQGVTWKYCSDNASPTSRQVVCKPASRLSSDSSSTPGCTNSNSLRACPSSRCASPVAPIRLCGLCSSSSRLCSASLSEWNTERGNS